jgi:uncharacterized protein (TIGR02118 family)
MIKLISLIPRRADFTREAFRNHYETRHAPLALQHYRMFRKYLRNHVVSGPEDLPFDVMSEFWYLDKQAIVDAGALLYTPGAQQILEDEKSFMDRSGTYYFISSESLLAGPPRIVESAPIGKQLFVFKQQDGVDPQAFSSDVRQCVRQATGDAHRITLDTPESDDLGAPSKRFVDAIVSVWPKDSEQGLRLGSLPASVASCVEVYVTAHETPPDRLGN